MASSSSRTLESGGRAGGERRRPAPALWRRLRRDPVALSGLGLVIVFLIAATMAPRLAPSPPLQLDLRHPLSGFGRNHLLGTDQLGRDILSRLIWGSRVSLFISTSAVGLALAIGGYLGLTSGILGGRADLLIMRAMDILLSFPSLIVALLIVAIFKPSLTVVIVAVGLTAVPNFARLIRGEVLALRSREYVFAALAMGASRPRIAVRHVVPNLLSPVIVMATSLFATAIITEANLSFLGLGVPQDVPSWGRMVNEGQAYLLSHPLLPVVPGLVITLVVVGVNFLGDFLRDVLDPRLK